MRKYWKELLAGIIASGILIFLITDVIMQGFMLPGMEKEYKELKVRLTAMEDSLADYKAMPDSILFVFGDCSFMYYPRAKGPGLAVFETVYGKIE
mgnify:CR=1 FL=1